MFVSPVFSAFRPSGSYAHSSQDPVNSNLPSTTQIHRVFASSQSAEVFKQFIENGLFFNAVNTRNQNQGGILGPYLYQQLQQKFPASLVTRRMPYASTLLKDLNLKIKAKIASLDTSLEQNASTYQDNRSRVIAEHTKALCDTLQLPLGVNTHYVDIGCGTGQITKKVATQLGIPLNNVTALEVSLAPSRELHLPISYFNGSTLPKAANTVDFATLFLVLHHTKNLFQARMLLTSVFRSLKPGGYLIIREHDVYSDLARDVLQVRHAFFSQVARIDTVNMPPDTVYLSREEWTRQLEQIGFKVLYHQYDPTSNTGMRLLGSQDKTPKDGDGFYLVLQKPRA